MSVKIADAVVYFVSDLTGLRKGLGDGERETQTWAGRIGTVVRNAVSTAIGNVISEAVMRGTRALAGLASEGLNAVASYERMASSIETLVAREIKNNSGIEREIFLRNEVVGLTDKQRAQLDRLRASQAALTADIGAAEARLEKMIATGKTDARIIEERRQSLEAMRQKLAQTTQQIAELEAAEGRMVPVYRKVIEGQISMAEALEQAGPKARELVYWTERLALLSPFDSEGVATALRTAMAYGFASDEAQRMTEVLVDFASGSGQSVDAVNSIARALGQIQAKGKLAAQEVLQLTDAGVPVYEILGRAFGKTTDELQKMQEQGLLPAKEVIDALVKSLGEDFEGAAERQATSWAGIKAAMEEAREIGLRHLFQGILAPFAEPAAGLLDYLTSPEMLARLDEAGQRIGEALQGGIDRAGELWTVFQEGYQTGGVAGGIRAVLTEADLPPELIRLFDNLLADMQAMVPVARDLAEGGLKLLSEKIIPALGDGLKFVNDHWEGIKDLLVTLATVGGALAAASALTKTVGTISAVITAVKTVGTAVVAAKGAGGILAGLGAAIGALGGPITVIAVAIGLLAAAWINNWGGIRDTLTDFWNNTARPFFENVWAWLSTNIPQAIKTVKQFWDEQLWPALVAIGEWFSNTWQSAVQAAGDIWNWLVGLWQSAVQFITVDLVGAFTTAKEWLADKLTAAANALGRALNLLLTPFRAVWGFISDHIIPLLQALANVWLAAVDLAVRYLGWAWRNVLLPALRSVWEFIQNTLVPLLASIFAPVIGAVSAAVDALAAVWRDVLEPALRSVWRFITDSLWPLLKNLGETILDALRSTVEALAKAWNEALLPALKDVWQALCDVAAVVGGAIKTAIENLTGWLERLEKTVREGIGKALTWFREEVLNPLTRAFESIGNWIDGLTNKLNEFAKKLRGIETPPELTPGSPTPFEIGLRGISAAMDELARKQLPRLSAQFALAGPGLLNARAGAQTIKNYYLTANYRNTESEGSLRDTIAALSML